MEEQQDHQTLGVNEDSTLSDAAATEAVDHGHDRGQGENDDDANDQATRPKPQRDTNEIENENNENDENNNNNRNDTIYDDDNDDNDNANGSNEEQRQINHRMRETTTTTPPTAAAAATATTTTTNRRRQRAQERKASELSNNRGNNRQNINGSIITATTNNNNNDTNNNDNNCDNNVDDHSTPPPLQTSVSQAIASNPNSQFESVPNPQNLKQPPPPPSHLLNQQSLPSSNYRHHDALQPTAPPTQHQSLELLPRSPLLTHKQIPGQSTLSLDSPSGSNRPGAYQAQGRAFGAPPTPNAAQLPNQRNNNQNNIPLPPYHNSQEFAANNNNSNLTASLCIDSSLHTEAPLFSDDDDMRDSSSRALLQELSRIQSAHLIQATLVADDDNTNSRCASGDIEAMTKEQHQQPAPPQDQQPQIRQHQSQSQQSQNFDSSHELSDTNNNNSNSILVTAEPMPPKEGQLSAARRQSRLLYAAVAVMLVVVIAAIVIIVLATKKNNDNRTMPSPFDSLGTILAIVPTLICHSRIPVAMARTEQCQNQSTRGSGVANIVAKAYWEQSNVDIVIISAGLIQKDIQPGNLTVQYATEMLPFPNTLMVAQSMTGLDIRKTIQQGIEAAKYPLHPPTTGAYPYAAGLRFSVNASDSQSSTSSVYDVQVYTNNQWTNIQDQDRYSVMTPSHLAFGGDNYTYFKVYKNWIDTGKDSLQVFMEYLWQLSPNRLTIGMDDFSTVEYIFPNRNDSGDGTDNNDVLSFQDVIATVPETICNERIPGLGKSNICPINATITQGGGVPNLIAQAFRWKVPQAQIALINSGLCRDDIRQGNFTVNDANIVLPFINRLFVVSISGKEILQLLEQAMEATLYPIDDPTTGAYPYASGLRFHVNMTMPFGKRVTTVEVNDQNMENGNNNNVLWLPIQPMQMYPTVVNSFIVSGRDNYTLFTTMAPDRLTDTTLEATKAFIEYAQYSKMLLDLPKSQYSTQYFVDIQ